MSRATRTTTPRRLYTQATAREGVAVAAFLARKTRCRASRAQLRFASLRRKRGGASSTTRHRCCAVRAVMEASAGWRWHPSFDALVWRRGATWLIANGWLIAGGALAARESRVLAILGLRDLVESCGLASLRCTSLAQHKSSDVAFEVHPCPPSLHQTVACLESRLWMARLRECQPRSWTRHEGESTVLKLQTLPRERRHDGTTARTVCGPLWLRPIAGLSCSVSDFATSQHHHDAAGTIIMMARSVTVWTLSGADGHGELERGPLAWHFYEILCASLHSCALVRPH